jgi:hypothetical protein
MRAELDDPRGRSYLSCRVQVPFSSKSTHLWLYEQQVFRPVIKADDAIMLVTGTDFQESE